MRILTLSDIFFKLSLNYLFSALRNFFCFKPSGRVSSTYGVVFIFSNFSFESYNACSINLNGFGASLFLLPEGYLDFPIIVLSMVGEAIVTSLMLFSVSLSSWFLDFMPTLCECFDCDWSKVTVGAISIRYLKKSLTSLLRWLY